MTLKPYTTVIDPDSKKAKTVYPFTIRRIPGGKWWLLKGTVKIAEFLTKEDAHSGLLRCLEPEEYYYDQYGNEIP